MKITVENNEAKWLLRMADTSLVLGQRLAELCSKGPFLEEDIAISNISLDLFGRAEELYKIIAKIEGNKFTSDQYVFHRNEREFYNLKLVEQPNEDFAWMIARQFFHDIYAKEVFAQLKSSSNEELSGLANKVLKEIEYSLIHSRDWMYRLGLGTDESNKRLQEACDRLLRYSFEMFNFDELDKTYLTDTGKIEKVWQQEVKRVLSEVNINKIELKEPSMRDYREGFHSEYLGNLLSIMQYIPRAYPDAKW